MTSKKEMATPSDERNLIGNILNGTAFPLNFILQKY